MSTWMVLSVRMGTAYSCQEFIVWPAGLQKSLFLRNMYKDLKIHSKVTKHFQDHNEIRLCRSLFRFGTADNG